MDHALGRAKPDAAMFPVFCSLSVVSVSPW